jgi:hypothetical protein
MKIVNRLGINLLALLLLVSGAALFAQTPEKLAPTFALAIEQKPPEAENAPGTLILLVKYTNVSNVIQYDDCMITPSAYRILVLRDGIAAEKGKPKRATEINNEENSTGYRIKVTHTEQDTCRGGVDKGLNPGQGVKFPLWVSSEYDITVPGTYDIAVTRETYPLNPEKSVTVKSNTLTIVVPEPSSVTPQ